MRTLSLVALIPLVSACSSASPDLMGANRRDVTCGGIRFSVFQQSEEAQVIRLGYLTRAQRAPVHALMVQAAERATGCAVVPGSLTTRIPGDTGVANLRLDCGIVPLGRD